MVMKFKEIPKERCMVKKMNKSGFIEELEEKTNLPKDSCILITEVLENHFFLGEKQKELVINELKEKLQVDESEAVKLYEIAKNILKSELKNKLKHPFGKQK